MYIMRIIQVLDALDYGDGVSNSVINYYILLNKMGYETSIYSKWFNEKVSSYRKNIDDLVIRSDDIVIHHFSGKSNIINIVSTFNCTKILCYHNITPLNFFDKNKTGIGEGEKQLLDFKNIYDYYIGDSSYNISSLKELGIESKFDVLPILIDFSQLDKVSKKDIHNNIEQKIFIFVGRVAPNKKHEDIIDVFEEYFVNINNNSMLYLIGNYNDYPEYFDFLKNKLEKLLCKEGVIFTGKVSNEELYNYYKNADVFICMSEHEGFCIPILESMYCGVPTIAFDSCAISSTMGNSGVLVKNKNYKEIARLIHYLFINENIKNEIVVKQKIRTLELTEEKLKIKLESLIKVWQENNNDKKSICNY